MTLPPERAGSAAPDDPGGTTTDGGADERPMPPDPPHEAKPVLEWSKEDWARWIESPPPIAPPAAEAPEPPEPAPEPEPLGDREPDWIEAYLGEAPGDPWEEPEPAPEPARIRWQGDHVEPVGDVDLDEPAPPPPPSVDDWVPEDVIVDVGLPEEDDRAAGEGTGPATAEQRYDLFADDVVSGADPVPPDRLDAAAPTGGAGPPTGPPGDLSVDAEVDDHEWAFGPDRPWWEPPPAAGPPPPPPVAHAVRADAAGASDAAIVPPPFEARPLADATTEAPPGAAGRRSIRQAPDERRVAVVERAPHRVRSALGLLAVSMVVGLVLAALITVAVFAIGVALRRAVG